MEFGGRPIRVTFFKKAAALAFLPLAVFLLSGCQIKNWALDLKKVDEKIGEVFNDFQAREQGAALNIFSQEKQTTATTTTVLTEGQKKKIDDWLDEKGLNRYGDDKSAMYKGGTPLYNEETGQAIDRYDYLLSRYPNLLEEIK
jgi:hypothetical protein